MTDNLDRRRLLQLSIALVPALVTLGNARLALAEDPATPTHPGTGPEHDFDFFLGEWNVKHRRLKKRLVGNNEWEEFDGTTKCQSLLGGMANMNESTSNR